jgi:hypothetical protein
MLALVPVLESINSSVFGPHYSSVFGPHYCAVVQYRYVTGASVQVVLPHGVASELLLTTESGTTEERLKEECEASLSCSFHPYKWDKSNKKKIPYVLGKTGTYFRKGALEYLESNRVLELDTMAPSTVIQKRARGVLARLRMAAIRRNTPRIQGWYRIMKARRKLRKLARKRSFLKAQGMFKSPPAKFKSAGSVFR